MKERVRKLSLLQYVKSQYKNGDLESRSILERCVVPNCDRKAKTIERAPTLFCQQHTWLSAREAVLPPVPLAEESAVAREHLKKDGSWLYYVLIEERPLAEVIRAWAQQEGFHAGYVSTLYGKAKEILKKEPHGRLLRRAGRHAPPFQLSVPPPDPVFDGCTYFLAWQPSGPIKVGRAKDPSERMKGYMYMAPLAPYRCLAVFADYSAESRAHEALKAFRLVGEWFQRGAALTLLEHWLEEGSEAADSVMCELANAVIEEKRRLVS